MLKQTSRRGFLRNTTLASVAAASGLAGWLRPGTSAGIEPIEREGGPKYKFSLAGYSYRNLLTDKNAEFTLEDFVRDCARFGFEGTEPTSYYFPQPVTNEYLCRLKALAFRLGLSISSTAIRSDFCLPPGESRERELAHVRQWIDYAQVMGAPVIRIFSGGAGKDQSPDEAHRLSVEGIEQSCEYAGQRGIFLGLENHGGVTSTADGVLSIVRDVKSPWFGAWMDTGNFHSADVYAELERIAPFTIFAQVKVVVSEQGGAKQPSDFRRLAKILGDVGYRGWICLEYEENDDPRVACPKYLELLREAFSAS